MQSHHYNVQYVCNWALMIEFPDNVLLHFYMEVFVGKFESCLEDEEEWDILRKQNEWCYSLDHMDLIDLYSATIFLQIMYHDYCDLLMINNNSFPSAIEMIQTVLYIGQWDIELLFFLFTV